MKSKHILHIGEMRCATTWLWNQLVVHPEFDQNRDIIKEHPILIDDEGSLFSDYETIYNRYNISANFNTQLCLADTFIIKFLNQYATHISITFQNPYELVSNCVSWLHEKKFIEYSDFTDMLIFNQKHTNYYDIVTRWQQHAPSGKFKILYFEELIANHKQTLINYFEFLDLEPFLIGDYTKKANSGKLKLAPVVFNKVQTKYINNEISKFETLTKRDCSHWYR